MKYPNGSEAVMSTSPWSQLIGVKNCPCSDGKARTVSRIGIPDTMFSAPGRISIKGKTVTGFVTCDEQGYTFHSNKYGKNGNII